LRKQAIADRRCNALKLNDNDRVHQWPMPDTNVIELL
jgi:hypothetical protein